MFVGIDPDLHDLAIGYWLNSKPVGAKVIHVPKRKGRTGQLAVLDMVMSLGLHLRHFVPKGTNGLAIEAQSLQRLGIKQHKRPQDIVILGNVAGAALGLSATVVPLEQIRFPSPETWKGQIPKAVMQARLYTDLGWGYEMVSDSYSRPLRPTAAFNDISSGQWKHVGDALLLARWASEHIS
jgi:hypothetical protein